ncbi:MAG TPA: histidinol-phosphatase [Gaiellaceae bacterium]|nr:histidinol-phosphatase [Gaiellaceae bacterium]
MTGDLAFALELADAADAITLRRFRAVDLRVDTKPDDTLVSDADKAAEDAIRELIRARRPGEGVLGEEGGDEGGDVRWVVDPIDGTQNFVRGVPIWATLIALEREGVPVAAVASAPGLRRRWWAERGGGAFADGETIHVSHIVRLEDASVSVTSPRAMARAGYERQYMALSHAAWSSRGLGDFWQHCLVAEGAVDVVLEPELNTWDYVPVQLVVEEAGGRCTDFEGEPPAHGSSFLSTNGLLHDAVVAALR